MIFTDRTITVRKGESRIDEPIVVYRGDYELEVRFTILNSRFKFMSGTNMIESEKASYGQLAILTPYGGNIFSDIVRCNDGSVTFVLTAEMLNQIEEVGLYSFQIRLVDYNKESRVSIPPIEFGIEVREPIASEDHDNSVNNAIVGYSIAKVVDPKEENVGDTFDESGNYNKTKWETGDRISEGKLNKIEDAIDKVNRNEKDNTVTLNKRIDNNFNVLDATKADITMVSKLNDKIENFENRVSGISNVLYGKKWVACGDSYTEGDFLGFVDENGLSGKNSPVLYDSNRAMYKTYPWWIAERNNMILINEAKGGSTMALSNEYLNGTNSDINYRNPFSLNRYKNIPLDADYLTLWFGLNETKTPLGTLDDTDNTTIIGAWNVVLEYFLTNMPYCKIGIVISDGWLNDRYANGIISVAEYWGIPYLDLRNDPKVPLMLGGRGGSINLNNRAKILRNNAFYVTENNAHPNIKAHEYQSTFIEHWMRSL